MILIGLTGGIASGKSTVSKMLKKMNIPVIDADEVSRNVAQAGSQVIYEIVKKFGNSVVNDIGELNRKELSKIVFSDRSKLITLNSIIQPVIRKNIEKNIENYRVQNIKMCVVDIPLLYEFNYSDMMNYIIVVYVNSKFQIERLKKRDKINEDEALKVINSQMHLEEKAKYADFVIDNSKTLEETYKQLNEILNKIYVLEDFNG